MSRYQGMVLSGRAYTAHSGLTQSFTLATTPTTTSALFAIYNPIGSGVNMVLWKTGSAIGGTPGTAIVGEIVIAANTDTTKGAPTGGSTITPTHNFLGNVMGFASKASVFAGTSAITLTGGTPTVLRSLHAISGPVAIAGTTTVPVEIDLGGDYVLAPGSAASIHALGQGAGTFFVSLSWAEIPLAP